MKIHDFETLGELVKFTMSLTPEQRKTTYTRWTPKGWDKKVCPKCKGKGTI